MLISVENFWSKGSFHRGKALEIERDKIVAVADLGNATPDQNIFLAAPYLTDLQVNGGGGVMVNSQPTTEGIQTIVQAHRKCGTGTILPTVITDHHDVIEAASLAALALKDEAGIGGIHIEGPHIDHGRRGTHNPDFIRPLDEKTVRLVEHLRGHDFPVMLTLAPELADSDLLSRLIKSGAVVSGGHSAATAEQTKKALGLGLSCFTHLYNAMPPMTSRAPGILGTAINSSAYAGIIADGIHVSWDMIALALRARPHNDLTFAVSDAMATVGGPDHFELYGQKIFVKDGALINAEGSLAGAHIDLLTSFKNLVQKVELPMEQAFKMVSEVPRKVMGLPEASIDIGAHQRDILFLDAQFNMTELT